MQHFLSPVAVFAALVVGFVIDYFSFGHEAWRDKIAFIFYVAGIREGFNGGTVDTALLNALSSVVDVVKQAGNTYLASAETNLAVGIVIAGVELFAIGCLLPEKLAGVKWIGKWATWKFPKSGTGKIGWKLLAFAVVIGLLADNVGGAIGQGVNALIQLDCKGIGPVLNWLFVQRDQV